ncbi:MAG: endonuclease domain-containing protein [Bacteroidaceae bacterium]|mgnify:CR=1 FL=1|nr:endonuclease domain-containing protein [Bacteroidaceae bacterium]
MAKEKLYEKFSNIDNPILLDSAKRHRNYATEAESVLWQQLRGNKLGVKFRRQHVVGNFIVDFACLSHRFYIEIDGLHHLHGEQLEYDLIRKQYLESLGLTELRFTNDIVLKDLESVIAQIKNFIIKELPLDSDI